jgi:hypothetical protein
VRVWCSENGHDYRLVEEPEQGDIQPDTQSDFFRVKMLAETAPMMWWDWDAYPLSGFNVPDPTKQWEDKNKDQAVLYSPDPKPWKDVQDKLLQYYSTHPNAHLERGRFWKIVNAYTEYRPELFSPETYKHLYYHNLGRTHGTEVR